MRVFLPRMNSNQLIDMLAAHVPHDDTERQHCSNIIDFVKRNATCWWQRETHEGHITASAWVVNAANTHALLLHHAKLDCWVQPGGHLDASDTSVAAGAMREACEETGLDGLQFAEERLFDVDIHAIPARGAEPAHLHYDLRYRIISPSMGATISDESLGARWIPLTSLASPDHERSIARMAEKSLGKNR